MENEFEFYGLTDEQEEIARDLYENNKRWVGHYTLEEVDRETAECWRDDTDDDEYRGFLDDVLENGADLFSLTDHLGDFSQPIGEVAVY